MTGRRKDPFGAASDRFRAGHPLEPTAPPHDIPVAGPTAGPTLGDTDPGDPIQLGALIAELQATAEQLGAQLGDLGRAGRDAAAARSEQLPVLRRVLELAPPELRTRLAGAAASGLSATRDLADWLLAQMSTQTPPPEPEELTITPLKDA